MGDFIPLNRAKFTVVLVVVYLAIQLVIPAMQLARSEAARWSWQMYTRVPSATAYTVRMSDGAIISIDHREHLADSRGIVDLEPAFSAYLCDTISDASSVIVTRDSIMSPEEIPCH